MLLLIAGIVLFLAIHLVPQNPDLKARLVGFVGVWGYRVMHGVVAALSVVLIVLGYADQRGVDMVWHPPVWTVHLTVAAMLVAAILVFAAPFNGKIKEILTSPLSVALKIWAFSHLLSNGSLADIVLFGFFLFFAISYRISIRKRITAGLASIKPGQWRYDLYALVLGLAFYGIMLLWLHEWAFGVSPLGSF